jgi:hypothetical protein
MFVTIFDGRLEIYTIYLHYEYLNLVAIDGKALQLYVYPVALLLFLFYLLEPLNPEEAEVSFAL